jgi:O-antigen ligase
MIISTIFADSTDIAIYGGTVRNEGLLMMLTYIGACVLIGRLYMPKEGVFYVLCGTATLVAGYGIFQFYGFDFLVLYPTDLPPQTGNNLLYFATMSNRNLASTYLCLAFCVALVMFCGKTKKAHWYFLPLGLIIFYALLVCQTESGYIGLVVSIVLALPFIVSTRQAAARFFLMLAGCLGIMWIQIVVGLTAPIFSSYWAFARPYLLPAVLVLLALAATLFFIKIPPLPVKVTRVAWYALVIVLLVVFISSVPMLAAMTGNSSLNELSSILQGEFDDNFMSKRMLIWKLAVPMIPDRLLFGHGPDNFSYSFNEACIDEYFPVIGEKYDKLHNEYMQTLFDNGLLGLISMLTFYGSIIYSARKKLNNPLMLGLVVALLCYMGQAFFNFVSPIAHPVVWTLWGVSGALLYENRQANLKKGLESTVS